MSKANVPKTLLGRVQQAAAWGVILLVGCTQSKPETSVPKTAQVPPPADRPAVEPAKLQAAAPREIPVAEAPRLVAPANETAKPIAKADEEPKIERPEPIALVEDSGPQGRTAFYRADSVPAEIPHVVLSKGHAELCRVKVGDTMPEIELPAIGGEGGGKKLSELFGDKATVVAFWKSDRRMALEQLADLGPDVVRTFGEDGVVVIGVAVNESPDGAQATLNEAGAAFPNYLDADGRAFAQVGSEKLPRTYLLDRQGKILWFDIEYSLSTRRELHQALRAIIGDKQN